MKHLIEYCQDYFTGKTAVIGTALAGLFTWLFGSWEIGLQALFYCMIADYVMGILCGKKENKLSSDIGFKGLKKKFTILIILTLAVMLDRLLGQGWVFRTLVIYFYIGMEGISILENAARLNVPIPKKLKEALIQLQEGNKKEIKDQDTIDYK